MSYIPPPGPRFTPSFHRHVRGTQDFAADLTSRVHSEGLKAALTDALTDLLDLLEDGGTSEAVARLRLDGIDRQLRAIDRALKHGGPTAAHPVHDENDPPAS